jgi:hypothetical protein
MGRTVTPNAACPPRCDPSTFIRAPLGGDPAPCTDQSEILERGGLPRRHALGDVCLIHASAVLNHGGYTRSASAQGRCAECESMGARTRCVRGYTAKFNR